MASSKNIGGHLLFTMSRNSVTTTSILDFYHRSDSVSFEEVLWKVLNVSMHYPNVDEKAFAVDALALTVPSY